MMPPITATIATTASNHQSHVSAAPLVGLVVADGVGVGVGVAVTVAVWVAV